MAVERRATGQANSEAELCSFLKVMHCVAMCNGTIAPSRSPSAHSSFAARSSSRPTRSSPRRTRFNGRRSRRYLVTISILRLKMLDPSAVRKMITPRTTGILGVHLWGRPAPVEALQAIADEHGLKVMYDASHGFACTHEGTRLGNFGECEVFSFHATKFFNTFEGGAVVTNNDELAAKIRLMKNFGFRGL